MRILVVAPQPFFTPRGTPLSVYYRSLVMAEHGASIDLLTYGPGHDVDVPGIRIHRIPRIRLLEPVPVGPSWRKLLLDGLMILWTIGLLLKHRFAVVHAHEEAVFWCRYLKPVFGFKLIYDMHSSLPQQLENFRFTKSRILIGIFRILENSCLKTADAVITICPDLKEQALKNGVVPELHLLIENSLFEPVRLRAANQSTGEVDGKPLEIFRGAHHPVILYAGTFEPYQGVELLVRAFAAISSENPNARLLLVGGAGEQLRQIGALIDELGIANNCYMTGTVPRAIAQDYAARADVLVSPRLSGNNTPLKIYEQLASGKPLVATRIRSHTQVLNDSVCFLAEPEPESFGEALRAAVDCDKDCRARVGRAKALYDQEYSRPIYDQKSRLLREIVS